MGSGKTCLGGQFCYDGQCKDEAKPPLCDDIGTDVGIEITTPCRCKDSQNAACPAGNYCLSSGSCSETPPSNMF